MSKSIPQIIYQTVHDSNNKGLFKLNVNFPLKQIDNPSVTGFEIEFPGFRPMDPLYDNIGFWYQLTEFGDDKHLLYFTTDKSSNYHQFIMDYISDNVLSDDKSYLEITNIDEFLHKGALCESLFQLQDQLNR